MNQEKISVVTGANGFVGSHLVDLLLNKGHKVKCILRRTSDRRWLNDKPVEIYDSGLFDKSALENILSDANYLFHIAGVVKAKNKKGYFRGNVETTRNLLEASAKSSGRMEKVVIVSSQTASGPSLDGKPRTEEMPPNPITTYGRSKIAQEELAKTFMDRLPITIVRPPAVYGERDTEIFLVFKTYRKGLMTLIGFDNKKLSLIHAEDLANGLYLAAVKEISKGRTYFISSEEIYTWEQIGEVMSKAFGKKALTIRIPHPIVYSVAGIAQFFSIFSSKAATFNLEKARDFVQAAWTLDVSKAVKELGYRQNVSLEDGIQRTVDWYKEMKWL